MNKHHIPRYGSLPPDQQNLVDMVILLDELSKPPKKRELLRDIDKARHSYAYDIASWEGDKDRFIQKAKDLGIDPEHPMDSLEMARKTPQATVEKDWVWADSDKSPSR